MADEAKEAVMGKIEEVTSEQGSLASSGDEEPTAYGHDSAASKGVKGDLIPGGKGFPGPTGKA